MRHLAEQSAPIPCSPVGYVIYGAGGIGGAIGASLQDAGHDVVFIARGDNLATLRRDGIRVDLPSRTMRFAVRAVGSPADADIRDTDVVLLCVKSQDTLGALEALAPATTRTTAVVCVQNGVANEAMALRWFPEVYGAAIVCPADFLEPGVVRVFCEPSGLVDIGRYPRGVDERAVSVCGDLASAGFDALPREDVMSWKWTKLLVNVTNAVEALCGTPARDGRLGQLARAEAEQVADAAGIALAGEEADRERRRGFIRKSVGGVDRAGASTWQSVVRGAGIETDWLNGEIVVLGREIGVATPVNELLQRSMWDLVARGAAAGSVDEGALLARLG